MNKIQQRVSVEKQASGYFDHKELYSFLLKNNSVEIGLTNLGCTITSIRTPDQFGNRENIVAGFKTLAEYGNNKDFFGCIVGRYANRIAKGKFTISNLDYQVTVNDGINHLHGGNNGFNKQVWEVVTVIDTPLQAGVEFHYLSKDGEEGFPGNLNVTVQYLLNQKDELTIHYRATTDKATPISLTNHSYFNLSGFSDETITGHLLQINADEYTEKNADNQPTGRFLSVSNAVFDFRTAKEIGQDLASEALKKDDGYDHNFVLKHENSNEIVPAAWLTHMASRRVLNILTSTPGIQVYSANLWDGNTVGAQGKRYIKHGAVALETQAFPDSPNHHHFPNTILFPGQEYQSTTVYAFNITSNQ